MMIRTLLLCTAALFCTAAFSSDSSDDAGVSAGEDNIVLAQNRRDDRRDRRDDRQEDRQGDRDGRQDCRQDEGRVGNDKRECKQENRGEDDDVEADGGE
jgi:hypothetical protein